MKHISKRLKTLTTVGMSLVLMLVLAHNAAAQGFNERLSAIAKRKEVKK
jgi:hypothetical protein